MTRWLPLTLYHHRDENREAENRTVDSETGGIVEWGDIDERKGTDCQL